jgi:hypothetical protein
LPRWMHCLCLGSNMRVRCWQCTFLRRRPCCGLLL